MTPGLGYSLIGAGLVFELIAFAVTIWLIYIVTKLAVRDGVRDSGLIEAIEALAAASRPKPEPRKWSNTEPADLPHMRADR